MTPAVPKMNREIFEYSATLEATLSYLHLVVLAQNFWYKRVAVIVKENVTHKYVSEKDLKISQHIHKTNQLSSAVTPKQL